MDRIGNDAKRRSIIAANVLLASSRHARFTIYRPVTTQRKALGETGATRATLGWSRDGRCGFTGTCRVPSQQRCRGQGAPQPRVYSLLRPRNRCLLALDETRWTFNGASTPNCPRRSVCLSPLLIANLLPSAALDCCSLVNCWGHVLQASRSQVDGC
jgi:hypothetical protein